MFLLRQMTMNEFVAIIFILFALLCMTILIFAIRYYNKEKRLRQRIKALEKLSEVFKSFLE